MTIITDLPKLDSRICTAYIADAEQNPRNSQAWHGVWGVPGTLLDYVRATPDQPPAVFHNKRTATDAAREMGYSHLNRRIRDPQRKFDRLTPEAFAAALTFAAMDETGIAAVWGCRPEKVRHWKEGRETVPFAFWWLFPLLRKAEDRAFIIHESAQHRREPTEE